MQLYTFSLKYHNILTLTQEINCMTIHIWSHPNIKCTLDMIINLTEQHTHKNQVNCALYDKKHENDHIHGT